MRLLITLLSKLTVLVGIVEDDILHLFLALSSHIVYNDHLSEEIRKLMGYVYVQKR